MSNWTKLCEQRVGTCARRVAVFDQDDASIDVNTYPELVQHVRRVRPDVTHQIRVQLATEVDDDQAALFARRFIDVSSLLERAQSPLSEVLLIGLVLRATEILGAAGPHALRIRAVVDYFYSQAAVDRYAHVTRPTWASCIAAARWDEVGPGVQHAQLDGLGPVGPHFINLLRVTGRTLHTLDARPTTDLVQLATSHGALAAVSGGFFLYSEPSIEAPCRRTDPVGLLVTDGELANPPLFRRGSLLQAHDGTVSIERLGLQDCVLHHAGSLVPVAGVNQPGPGLRAWTRARASVAPRAGWQVVARRVTGFGTAIPVGGAVFTGVDLLLGEELDLRLIRPVRAGMAGGPVLTSPAGPVRDLLHEDFTGTAPPITFSQDETYDQNLLPRMAVGLEPTGTAVFAAIDGRNLDRAPGLTLQDTANLMDALGCPLSLNLDGGSSKRMVVAGRQVDLSSTEVVTTTPSPTRMRPVNSAILIR